MPQFPTGRWIPSSQTSPFPRKKASWYGMFLAKYASKTRIFIKNPSGNFPTGFSFQLDENALRFCPRQAAADIYCVFSFRHPRTVKPGNYNIVYDPLHATVFLRLYNRFRLFRNTGKDEKKYIPPPCGGGIYGKASGNRRHLSPRPASSAFEENTYTGCT